MTTRPRVLLTLSRPKESDPRPKNHQDYRDRLLEQDGSMDLVSVYPHSPESAIATEFDALVLSGGGDIHPDEYGGSYEGVDWDTVDRDRDRLERRLLDIALSEGLPVFGICRGFQMIAIHLGGKLQPHVVGHRKKNGPIVDHFVTPLVGSRLEQISGPRTFRVNSRHHQIVADLPDTLIGTASVDGVLEAFESREKWIVAVQWHPETRPDDALEYEPADRLFRAFVHAAEPVTSR